MFCFVRIICLFKIFAHPLKEKYYIALNYPEAYLLFEDK